MGGAAEVTISLADMHRHLGHISSLMIKKMVAEKAFVGPQINEESELKSCDSCEYGKTTCRPLTKTRQTPCAKEFGAEIHSHLWGPSPVMTPGKHEFYVSFTDDYSH